MKKILLMFTIVAFLGACTSSSSTEEKAEDAVESVEEAADEAMDEMEEAADETTDSMEEAGEEVVDEIDSEIDSIGSEE